MPQIIALIIVFGFVIILGAVIGSFLNVCIYRFPLEKSVIWPGSHCPKCLRPVRPSDNIPILSWFILRGRCRHCGEPFSPRYMLIESLTAALFGCVLWLNWPLAGMGWCRYAYQVCLLAALIVATFIDFDLKQIPDSVTVPGTLIGLLGGTLIPDAQLMPITDPAPHPNGLAGAKLTTYAALIVLGWALWVAALVWQFRLGEGGFFASEVLILLGAFTFLSGHSAVLYSAVFAPPQAWPGWPLWLGFHTNWQGLATGVIGMLVGGMLIWFVRVVGTAAVRREAMGFGDVTLMAMMGTFLGWQPMVLVFFLAPFLALGVGLFQWLLKRDREIPYGPYLSLAAALTLFFWGALWPRVMMNFQVLALVPAPWAVLFFLPLFLFCLLKADKHLRPVEANEQATESKRSPTSTPA